MEESYNYENEFRNIYKNLISTKGRDNKGHQIISLYLSNLPDPQVINYDLFSSFAIKNLDNLVKNDYVLVLFCSDVIYKPSWSWVIQTYKTLDRDYKKNLKSLYIVHPSFWTRVFVATFTKILSPKFGQKIVWINSLYQLSRYIPYNEINIPLRIFEYERNHDLDKIMTNNPSVLDSSSSSSNSSNSSNTSDYTPTRNNSSNVFGVPLEKTMGYEGENGIPKVVSDAIEFLLENGLKEEGLFRRSPSIHLIKTVKEAYNSGNNNITIQSLNNVHLAAVILKTYVRELPNPIFPPELYPEFKKINYEMDKSELSVYLNENILDKIPTNNRLLFTEICRLLKEVHLNSEVNLMSANNLAIVWAPNLVKSGKPLEDFEMATVAPEGTLGSFVRWAIENYDILFAFYNTSSTSSIRESSTISEGIKPKNVIYRSNNIKRN
ncbi:Rho GTPase activation protein [Anaeromyces robustus]|uniref:Rho GTPase activation protein n=1 Tax=Anaeromyces robustus TaxID=1754192 RepID=A0A1Y1XJM2_9FUNG|nr:Rho GTPase activation protein [Anaeromyces robustus]|eukprot:ORX85902.1 Rho GTPase activation protein [Anaeromyces robustus]